MRGFRRGGVEDILSLFQADCADKGNIPNQGSISHLADDPTDRWHCLLMNSAMGDNLRSSYPGPQTDDRVKLLAARAARRSALAKASSQVSKMVREAARSL